MASMSMKAFDILATVKTVYLLQVLHFAAAGSARAHARQQNAEYCDSEAQPIRVVGKVDEANENKRGAVSHVTEQHQTEHQSNAALYSIGEGVDICSRGPVVEVAQQRVADGGAGDGECQGEHLEEEVAVQIVTKNNGGRLERLGRTLAARSRWWRWRWSQSRRRSSWVRGRCMRRRIEERIRVDATYEGKRPPAS